MIEEDKTVRQFLCCVCNGEKPLADAYSVQSQWPRKALFKGNMSDGKIIRMMMCKSCFSKGGHISWELIEHGR